MYELSSYALKASMEGSHEGKAQNLGPGDESKVRGLVYDVVNETVRRIRTSTILAVDPFRPRLG